MIFKLTILAGFAVTGVYGGIEVLFLDSMSLGLRLACFLGLAVMGYLGSKGFEKNWKLYCRDDYEIIRARKQVRRERIASAVLAALFV